MMTNGIEWEFSSAGRASALQAEGHRFEPCNSHQFSLKFPNGPVVQLVRTPPCHGGGRGFESHPGRHYADLAHLVERHLAKVEVASSSLVIRSNKDSSWKYSRRFFCAFLKLTAPPRRFPDFNKDTALPRSSVIRLRGSFYSNRRFISSIKGSS